MLNFPNKSHRIRINIPDESVSLAELMGIIFGDGGISNGQLTVSLNSNADYEYSKYVYLLLESLFQIDVALRKRPDQNTIVVVCSSLNLVDFLMSKGMVRGNKVVQQIDIPEWISANEGYKNAFVRGLVDTDGCLYIHKHKIRGRTYSNLGFCFTNYSSRLINSVALILSRYGIKPIVTQNGTRIFLYSQKSVLKYLQVFGSSNDRILNKVQEWSMVNDRGYGEVA